MKSVLFSSAVALIVATAPVAAFAAPPAAAQTTATAFNAVQKQADRANKDRWQRTDTHPAPKSTDDKDTEDTDEDASDHHSEKQPAPVHPGELNGKLHLGEW